MVYNRHVGIILIFEENFMKKILGCALAIATAAHTNAATIDDVMGSILRLAEQGKRDIIHTITAQIGKGIAPISSIETVAQIDKEIAFPSSIDAVRMMAAHWNEMCPTTAVVQRMPKLSLARQQDVVTTKCSLQ
jgi:hypothetical protein